MYGLLDCEPYTRAQRGGLIDVREMRKHALGDLEGKAFDYEHILSMGLGNLRASSCNGKRYL